MPLDNEQEVTPVVTEEVENTELVEKQQEPTLAESETEGKTEVDGEKPEDKPAIPKGLQKRLDRLTREKHELKAALEAERQARQSERGETTQIDRSQFNTEDEYLDAVLEHRATVKQAAQSEKVWAEKRDQILGDAEDSGVDLDEFAKLPVTRAIADAIIDSDVPVELVAYLTENPKEAKRIAALSNSRQAAEIGKIEATLSGSAKPVAKTAAPAPIRPVSGNGKPSLTYRADMSLSEYAKWRGRKL